MVERDAAANRVVMRAEQSSPVIKVAQYTCMNMRG